MDGVPKHAKIQIIPQVDGEPIVNEDGSIVEASFMAAPDADIEVKALENGVEITDNYVIPGAVYVWLKWLCIMVLPALALLIDILGNTWGWANYEAWATTVNSLAVFLGAIIGVSALNNYRK